MFNSKVNKVYSNLITQMKWQHEQQEYWDLDDQNGNRLHKKYGNYNNWLARRPSSNWYSRKKPTSIPTGEKCPKCGSNLVKKQGRFGEFIGCENYPTCKFIKKDQATTNFTPTPLDPKDILKQIPFKDSKKAPIKITENGTKDGVVIYNSYPIKDCIKQIGGRAYYLSHLKAWRIDNITLEEITDIIQKYMNENNL